MKSIVKVVIKQYSYSKMELYRLGEVFTGEIVKRPSKLCKTPYMADVILDSDRSNEIMAHSPSLGCCGLAEKGSHVIMTSNEGKDTKSSHTIQLSIYQEGHYKVIVGIHPRLSEIVAERALTMNCIAGLENIQSYQREKKLLNSRFDFIGVDADGKDFVMEIKTVPLADYVDMPKKEKKIYMETHKDEIDAIPFDQKIAYFPDGYRKNNTDIVSPRALKHIQELEELVKTTGKRAILCFVIQRSDASYFQPSKIDPTYRKAVQQARISGVEIKTLQVTWNVNGICYFVRNDLPLHIFDDEIEL